MIKLTVEITVKNHNEIVALNKGAAAAKLAGLFGNVNNMVEEEVRNQVKSGIKKSLDKELSLKGVKADIKVY